METGHVCPLMLGGEAMKKSGPKIGPCSKQQRTEARPEMATQNRPRIPLFCIHSCSSAFRLKGCRLR